MDPNQSRPRHAKAAKDWPQLNFIIYHAAFRHLGPGVDPKVVFAEFERTGGIDWVSDLAEIPARHGVKNVYCDIGGTFGTTCIDHPRLAAAVLGVLIKGLGAEHVTWGTDSIWFGSPQWQIEALRRIEIPTALQKRFGFTPLGAANGRVKAGILGANSARLYGIEPKTASAMFADDNFAKLKADYEVNGGQRSNHAYGWSVRRRARPAIGSRRDDAPCVPATAEQEYDMKSIGRLKASTFTLAVTGFLCALAGFAVAETRNQMSVRPFEQVKFEPQDPKNPDGAQLAVLLGSRSAGPVAVLLKWKKGDIPMHSHTFPYHAVLMQGTAKPGHKAKT